MLSIEQLKKLSTQRLVAYKRKYFPRAMNVPFEYEKEYNEYHAAIKEILKTRGHVKRKHEKV